MPPKTKCQLEIVNRKCDNGIKRV
uniref:Uncharacterized protein n=1 Tax=Anguilla anguilla TaxID=7936 RepID=A0A0E9RZC8_ANGAN